MSKNKGKQETIRSGRSKFCPSIKPLPDDFEENLSKLEIQINENGTIEILRTLLEMYSQAIEYHEAMRNSKYRDYQVRMNNLLLNQDAILAPKPPKIQNSGQLLSQRAAEKTVKEHEFISHNASRQVQLNLKGQNDSLVNRVQVRKTRNLSTSPTPLYKKQFRELIELSKTSTRKNKESDISGGISQKKTPQELELELEKILEVHITEKLVNIQKIKEKYRKLGEEKHSRGEDTTHLDYEMMNEINDMENHLEDKRKESLRKLRNDIVETL
ncbi:unnamed protein product [Blepharisma stoltei]|uniref:Uncharacterized protein n=1 Tax=Blepharisma stoltei TaxID=1481888 RepID=A0AAU9K1F3_9CILI|nr:unnamed protein product [Blepharisma stoltei]